MNIVNINTNLPPTEQIKQLAEQLNRFPAGTPGVSIEGPQGPQGPPGPAGQDGSPGEPGPAGSPGADGAKGDKGDTGSQGPAGPTGPAGADGQDGSQGIQGIQGPAGQDGAPGAKGDTGDQGPKGDTGSAGAAGAQGIQGIQGPAGADGADGSPGAAGQDGAKGDKGDKGDTGAAGAAGSQGIQGPAGTNGTNGAKGDTGAAGSNGTNGAQGIQGIQGIKGDTGLTGSQGIQGVKGDTGSQGTQGVKGDTGSQGIQGIQGNPGSDASVTATSIDTAIDAASAQTIMAITDVIPVSISGQTAIQKITWANLLAAIKSGIADATTSVSGWLSATDKTKIDAMIPDSIMTIGRSATMTLSQTLATVPLAATVDSAGSGLVRTGNTIVVQAGIGHILVNAQILIASGLTALDTLEFAILKNAAQVGYLGAKATTTTWQPLVLNGILVPVTAGDAISIQVRNTTAARGVLHTSATSIYLTVQAFK